MKAILLTNLYTKHKNKKKIRYVFSDLKFLIITIAVVMIWRGVWNFLDTYFLTEYFILSNVFSIVIWISMILLFKIHFDAEDVKF